MPEIFLLMLNTTWYCTNGWCREASVPSDTIVNTTLTIYNTFPVVSGHEVLSFLKSNARDCSTVLGSCMPNIWLVFRYLACYFLMLINILSLFLSKCSAHQLKKVHDKSPVQLHTWLSALDGIFRPNNFSHEVELSFHCQQICQPTVDLQVTCISCMWMCWSERDIALSSFQ